MAVGRTRVVTRKLHVDQGDCYRYWNCEYLCQCGMIWEQLLSGVPQIFSVLHVVASEEKIVVFGLSQSLEDLGSHVDLVSLVSRPRKGLLRPTVRLAGLQPRARGERETDMQAGCSGYDPVSRGACCGFSVKVVRFGALAN
jgi:hypothetical protein